MTELATLSLWVATMLEDRLNDVVRRLHLIADDYDRAKAEAQRQADEAAERQARVERGWRTLQTKRAQILKDVNRALTAAGFQLHISSDFGVLKDNEIDYFLVDIRGREHPDLAQLRLRVALDNAGMVTADVITTTNWQRLRRMTYEEFTPAVWKDLLIEHLELASSSDQPQATS